MNGDDCWVVEDFPPHLNLHIKPRTADDSSQQFVEVTIGIKSSAQYPNESPHVYIVEEKGLDEKRQTHLITSIQNKASELSSCLMLVALCEEAVETLSNMNHPDGDCPLCLYPLVTEDSSGTLPFMKLMSCYHCFHCDCIMRLWNWLHEQNGTEGLNPVEDTSSCSSGSHEGTHTGAHQQKGNCPVCRKVFDSKDLEHVQDYLGADSSHLGSAGADTDEEDVKTFLQSDNENSRRQKFEAVLQLQKEKNGLIEPRKDLAIVPGMFLPETSTVATTEPVRDQPTDNPSDSTKELNSNVSSNKSTTSKRNNMGSRNARAYGPRRQPQVQSSRQQWVKKENAQWVKKKNVPEQ